MQKRREYNKTWRCQWLWCKKQEEETSEIEHVVYSEWVEKWHTKSLWQGLHLVWSRRRSKTSLQWGKWEYKCGRCSSPVFVLGWSSRRHKWSCLWDTNQGETTIKKSKTCLLVNKFITVNIMTLSLVMHSSTPFIDLLHLFFQTIP